MQQEKIIRAARKNNSCSEKKYFMQQEKTIHAAWHDFYCIDPFLLFLLAKLCVVILCLYL